MSDGDDGNRSKEKEAEDMIMKLWGSLFLFGLIGATATAYAVGQLRRNSEWFLHTQLSRRQSSRKGSSGRSYRSSYDQEEAWKQYNRRTKQEYEEELERVERIRHMQNIFIRERNKYKRSYDRWRENDADAAYHQHFQRDDWYWKYDHDTSYGRDWGTDYRETSRDINHSLSHHYSVLGLDRSRTTPYTDAEVKTAFQDKAKQFHPDQNQNNKEAAEVKFKEVMASYEAIKQERKK